MGNDPHHTDHDGVEERASRREAIEWWAVRHPKILLFVLAAPWTLIWFFGSWASGWPWWQALLTTVIGGVSGVALVLWLRRDRRLISRRGWLNLAPGPAGTRHYASKKRR